MFNRGLPLQNASCGSQRIVRVNGLALALAEWGTSDAPPLVLLHSLAAHSHWWDWMAPHWARRWRVVALDFRGHGASAHATPPAYAFDDYASDVVGVLDALAFERAMVIGHSMGAYVGALVAARHAERVRMLVIADMLTRWTEEQAERARRQAGRSGPTFGNREEAGLAFRLAPRETHAPEDGVRHLGETGAAERGSGAWGWAYDPRVLLHPPVDPWPFLPAVVCPTLVIHGEGSAIMDRRAAERVAASIEHGTVSTLPGAFHHLMLDAPAAFATAVDAWMTALGR